MRGIVLVAGRGRRLGELGSQQPKCLASLRGKTLLSRTIEVLRETGVEDIALVTGYRRDVLTSFGLHEFYNSDWSTSNMVYSLIHATPWLMKSDCVVSYGDIFYRPSAVRALLDADGDVSLTYDPEWVKLWSLRSEDPLADAETFRLRSNGTVCEIGRKPQSILEVEGQYMGLLKFTPRGWSDLISGSVTLGLDLRSVSMTEMLQAMIERRSMKVVARPYFESWGEVDTEADLAVYESSEFHLL